MRILAAALAALLVAASLAHAEDAAAPAPPPKLPPAEEGFVMDFPAYLKLVLEKHPELKMARAEARAKGEIPSQAESLPDPQLTVGVMNLPSDSLSFSEEDMTGKTVGLAQSFPGFGKRGLRRKVAEGDAAASRAMAVESALELIERARIGFYQLRYLMTVRETAEKNKETRRNFLDVAMTKYTVGEGLQQDVLNAQLEYSKMLEYIIGVDQRISTLRKTLNAWAGLPEGTDWRRPAIRNIDGIVGDDAELAARAQERRPLFAALEAQLEKAHGALELARRETMPDYAVSLSYTQRDDSPMRRSDLISAEVMIDLPLYKSGKQDRMVAESVHMEDKAREELAAERLRLRETIYELMDEQVKYQKLLVLYDTGLLMQAAQTVEASMIAYQVNKGDFFTMSMYQSTLFDYRIQRAEVEYELMAVRARLLRALGEDAAEAGYED